MEPGLAVPSTNLVARCDLVVVAAGEFAGRAAEVARALGLGPPLDTPIEAIAGAGALAEGGLALVLDEAGWSLVDPRPGAPGAVRCDLLEGGLAARMRDGARGESRLAKALGLKRYAAPLVLDATAGFGRESILAAALGCEVVACERSPVVALLLRDGLQRASDGGLDEIVGRITVRNADAHEVMAEMVREGARPDVVLVDPMFPARKKSAAAKKEMQLLQRLLPLDGPDDGEALLTAAIATARRRVVVKRPVHAPPLAVPGSRGRRGPEVQVAGRAARYDIYLTADRDAEAKPTTREGEQR